MYGIIPSIPSVPARKTNIVIPDPLSLLMSPLADAETALGNITGGFRADVKETEKDYQVSAELPGFAKEEVSIKLDKDVLVISCEHKSEEKKEEDDGQWLYRERTFAAASRSFVLPNADENNTSATLEDGILKVVVPKKEQSDNISTIEIS